MAKNSGTWGREKARERYAMGGRTSNPNDPVYAEQTKTPFGAGPRGRGGEPVEYYGTSREPSIGKRIEGPIASQKRSRTIYPNTPQGRKSMNRTIDKYDNEYGAYRHRGHDVVDE